MSLQYQLVWALLVSEMVAFVLLTLPLPLRWKSRAMDYLRGHVHVKSVYYVLRIFFVLVLFLFAGTLCAVPRRADKIDSMTRSLQLGMQKEALGEACRAYKDVHGDAQLNLKMFYAQRNMYLTGFTLFLAMYPQRCARQ